MRQWQGKNSKNHYDEIKSGRLSKLSLINQFFLTLVRLHLGLLELDLANRFNISKSSVSRITCTWINLMYHSLKAIERYPPWHIVKKYMPQVFEDYPNTRLIIDATKFLLNGLPHFFHNHVHSHRTKTKIQLFFLWELCQVGSLPLFLKLTKVQFQTGS